VLKENPIPHLEEAGDYMFGLWSGMDSELAKKTVATLNEALKTQIKVSNFETIPELLDALFNKQIDAMIFPDAFFGLLVDMEGYQDTEEKIRPLITLDFEIETGELEKPVMPDHTFTVYISGIDSLYGMTAKSRSDVNILAHVNTKTHQVLLVSTPRDYFVPLSISDGVPDKLTHAGIYGVDVSKDTVGMIYDMDIDYYFRVNFEGFEAIIDALGGVDVYSEYTFNVGPYHRYYEGMNHLNGEDALIFARERYTFSEGDRQRGKHQMEVIRGVINKVLSPEILKNYVGVLEAVEGNFETTVPYELIAQLVRGQLESNPDWEIISYSVNGTGDTQYVYSMSIPVYVVWPDWDTVDVVKNLVAQMENNQRISAP
jgi:LCP family protein required for cell wall assembly